MQTVRLYLEIYTCIHTHIYMKAINKKGGHEYDEEWEWNIWECLEGGKGKEKYDYIIISKKSRQRSLSSCLFYDHIGNKVLCDLPLHLAHSLHFCIAFIFFKLVIFYTYTISLLISLFSPFLVYSPLQKINKNSYFILQFLL